MSVEVPLTTTPSMQEYEHIRSSSPSGMFRTKASEVQGGVTTFSQKELAWDEGDDDGGGNADEETEILPIGDAILPMLLFALAYAVWKRRRTVGNDVESD